MSFLSRGLGVCPILLVSVACFSRNREAAVLAPLASDSRNDFSWEGIQPEYLAFDDALTASVFRRVNDRYRIAPMGTQLLCPSNPAPGMHGFSLRARAAPLRDNQAIGHIDMTCQQPHDGMQITFDYLLIRRNGGWQIVKPLGASIANQSRPTISFDSAELRAFADARVKRRLGRIEVSSDRLVRIASKPTGRIQADAFYQRGDSVFLVNERGTHGIPITDVDSVWAQQGTAALVVGLTAAIPCAVLGMIAGEFIASDPDGNRSTPGPVGALIGGLVGGIPCGLLGAGAGSFIRRWRLEYARPL